MYQSLQQFYNKRINTIVLAYVYCVEVLLQHETAASTDRTTPGGR
jgi:hypothetical protein